MPHPPALDAFVAPARPSSALWRTALGTVLIVAIYAASLAGLFGAAVLAVGLERTLGLVTGLAVADTAGGVLVLLASFAGMVVAPMLAVRLVHRRRAASLFGRAPRVLHDFVVASVAVGVLYAAALAGWSLVYDAVPGLPLDTWLTLLPFLLIGLLVQTGAEELVFRGYLLQQLAARTRARLVWMVAPSVVFGLVHYAPEMAGGNAWLVVVGAAVFGLLAADLTAATGSIGAAWGFHFVNNLAALGVLATDGTITGAALYLTPYAADAEDLPRLALAADVAMILGAWALCRLLLRR